MKLNDFTKKAYIPSLVSLIFSSLLFLLMLLPHNQYSLLSEMSNLNSETNLVDWSITLPAIFTLFTILTAVATFLMSLLSLFVVKIYNAKILHIYLLIIFSLEVISQTEYLLSGLILKNDEIKVIQVFNIVVYVLNLIDFIGYIYTSNKFVYQPYKKFKEIITEEKKDEPVYQETKKLVEEKKEEINISDKTITLEEKREMIKNIEDLVNKNVLDREKADSMIDEILKK